MLRILYRLLAIVMVCVLVLGSRTVHAQGMDNVCIRKTEFADEDLVFSPDNRYLVAAWDDENGAARLWDVETGKVMQEFSSTTPKTHYNASNKLGRFAFSSDGKYLLAGHLNVPIILLWDTQTGKKLYEIPPDGEIYSEGAARISILPNDQHFIIFGDYSLRIHDLKTGKQLYRFVEREGRIWFDWSQDYKQLLIGGVETESDLALWDIQTNKKLWSLDKDVFFGYFVDNDKYIAVMSSVKGEYTFTLWNASLYEAIRSIYLGDSFPQMARSIDGRYLLTVDEPISILWDVPKGLPLYTFVTPQYPETFTPDSRYILFSVRDEQDPDQTNYRLWDIEYSVENPDFQINNVFGIAPIFSPDGRYLLVGTMLADRQPVYQVWNMQQNQKSPKFQIDAVGDIIKFSPNSKYLVVASQNGRYSPLRLWNLETGEEMHLDC